MFAPIFAGILEIFGLFFIGGLGYRLGYLKNEHLKGFSAFIINFLLPPLIFSSILTNLDINRLTILWPLPLLGFGIMLLGFLLGIPLKFGLKSKDEDIRKTFLHISVTNNNLFLPLIMVLNIWGAKVLPNLFLFNLGSTIGVWTMGIGVLGGGSLKKQLKNILSPNLFAVLISLAILAMGVDPYIPDILLKIASTAGRSAPVLMMLIIGATLSQNLKKYLDRDLWYLTFHRLILIPVITIFTLKLLPLNPEVFNLALLVAIMPAAATSSIFTQHYGGSPEFAAKITVITTSLSLISIPILLFLFPFQP